MKREDSIKKSSLHKKWNRDATDYSLVWLSFESHIKRRRGEETRGR
jgi:hypothetical protein